MSLNSSLESLLQTLAPWVSLTSNPNSTTGTQKAPAIDVAYYLNIHTATYSYFTNASAARYGPDFPSPSPTDALASGGVSAPSSAGTVATAGGNGKEKDVRPHGTDLYEKLDRYYAEACQEILAGHPIDDAALIDYLLPCFQR